MMLIWKIVSVRLIKDVQRPDKLSSAEIASICQAAGLQGIAFHLFKLYEKTDMLFFRQTLRRLGNKLSKKEMIHTNFVSC